MWNSRGILWNYFWSGPVRLIQLIFALKMFRVKWNNSTIFSWRTKGFSPDNIIKRWKVVIRDICTIHVTSFVLYYSICNSLLCLPLQVATYFSVMTGYKRSNLLNYSNYQGYITDTFDVLFKITISFMTVIFNFYCYSSSCMHKWILNVLV